MARARRADFPGAWFHVMNRGSARRTIFENRADARFFLSLLAHTVRRGDIEVHAYCLMATHYHLLLRSGKGRLSAALQWVQDLYARWFNRRRRRDGPLFRGRFRAKLIPGIGYRTRVFHYVHRNPVTAGLVSRAVSYPYSSARQFARPTGTPWLSRAFAARLGEQAWEPTAIGSRGAELERRWLASGDRLPRDLEDLVGSAPSRVQAWMRRKQKLADGALPRLVLVHADTVLELVSKERHRRPDATVAVSRRRQGAWDLMACGLLRMGAGLKIHEIAERVGASLSTVHGRIRAHARALASEDWYHSTTAQVLARALRRDHQ